METDVGESKVSYRSVFLNNISMNSQMLKVYLKKNNKKNVCLSWLSSSKLLFNSLLWPPPPCGWWRPHRGSRFSVWCFSSHWWNLLMYKMEPMNNSRCDLVCQKWRYTSQPRRAKTSASEEDCQSRNSLFGRTEERARAKPSCSHHLIHFRRSRCHFSLQPPLPPSPSALDSLLQDSSQASWG